MNTEAGYSVVTDEDFQQHKYVKVAVVGFCSPCKLNFCAKIQMQFNHAYRDYHGWDMMMNINSISQIRP